MSQEDDPPAYSLAIHGAEELRAAGRELALAGDNEAALTKYTEAAAAFALPDAAARALLTAYVAECTAAALEVARKLRPAGAPPATL